MTCVKMCMLSHVCRCVNGRRSALRGGLGTWSGPLNVRLLALIRQQPRKQFGALFYLFRFRKELPAEILKRAVER